MLSIKIIKIIKIYIMSLFYEFMSFKTHTHHFGARLVSSVYDIYDTIHLFKKDIYIYS